MAEAGEVGAGSNQQAREEGFRSLRSISSYLNQRGIRTSRGNEWTATAVHPVMTR